MVIVCIFAMEIDGWACNVVCVGRVTDISAESGISEMSSNPRLVCCFHFHIDFLGKSFNLSFWNVTIACVTKEHGIKKLLNVTR